MPNEPPPATATADDVPTSDGRFWRGPIDLLPLGLFRLALGALLFVDTVELAPDVRLFYSDQGLWPRALALHDGSPYSLLWFGGSPLWATLVYAATLVALLALTVGFHARIACIASWVLLTSLHARFPFALDGSDSVARACLFFLCFCPSGNRVSLDALRASRRGAPLSAYGHAFPVRVLQAQIGAVYYATATWKLRGVTWRDGSAVHYALSIPNLFTRRWAFDAGLGDVPWLVRVATWGTLAVELAVLLSLFAPWQRQRLKAWALGAGLALHASIGLAMAVGMFSYLMPVTYLALAEPAWVRAAWRRARGLFGRAPAPFAPSPPAAARPARLGDVVLFATFVIVQLASSPARTWLPAPVFRAVDRTLLAASWRMFAPNPIQRDARLVGEARRRDGSPMPLFEAGGFPSPVRGRVFSRRWKVEEAMMVGPRTLLRGYAEWRCGRDYERLTGRALSSFDLRVESREIGALGIPRAEGPMASRVLASVECRDGELVELRAF